ncbi:hypothetical protein METP3_00151 [Methanosarcinales archaeon]|nr:hypothetical protein METP3_00151 [Methanosarcinales archaeon]
MNNFFATLDALRYGKTETAENLITTVINNGLVFIIVKTRISMVERIRKARIHTIECKKTLIYTVSNIEDVNDSVSFLSKLHWHKPICHFLIGKKGLEEKIKNACQSLGEDFETFEQRFDSDILCYIEPLDEQLDFYADEVTKKMLLRTFPFLAD